MKKKLLISTIIGTIVVILLTMYITILAVEIDPHEIGGTRKFALLWPRSYPEKYVLDEDGNKIPELDESGNPKKDDKGKTVWKTEVDKSAINIIMTQNISKYYCVNEETGFRGSAFWTKHYNVANVEITGDTVKLQAGLTFGETTTEPYEETYVVDDTDIHKVISLVYHKIKNGTVTLKEDVDKDGNKKGNPVTLQRIRYRCTNEDHIATDTHPDKAGSWCNIEVYGTFQYDVGQGAIWRSMYDWRRDVAMFLDNDNKSLWGSVVNSIQTDEVNNEFDNEIVTLAYERSKQLYEETVQEVEGAVDNEYGIEEAYYNDSSAEKIPETYQEVEEFTILGPFKYKFGGTLQNSRPTLTFDEDTTEQEYTIGKYEGSTFTETNEIVSEQNFYIKVATSALENAEYIHFNFQVEGISLYATKTKIYFYIRETRDETQQTIIEIEQDEKNNEPFTDTYKLNKTASVTLTKTDEEGNTLAAGIKFQIKDETNAVIAYLETDANGNVVVTDGNGNSTGETRVKLQANKKYTIKETVNNAYGYKGRIISDAQLVNGNGEIKILDGGKLEITLTDDDEIKIENSPQLGDLTIVKKGTDGTYLKNVEFIIMRDNGYLRLNNESVIETTNEGLDVSEYHITTVGNIIGATKFKTNESGKIVLKNLEIYKSINASTQQPVEYKYAIYETKNENYGYTLCIIPSAKWVNTDGDTIDLNPKKMEITLTGNDQIEVENAQPLGDITIIKRGTEGTDGTYLKNVEFVVGRDNKYLKLDDETVIETTDEGLDVSGYNINTVTNVEEATRFKTNGSGKIVLNNLEIYGGVNSATQTLIKYKYTMYEINNENPGYTDRIISSAKWTKQNGQTQNLDVRNLELTLTGNDTVEIENLFQLGDITIIKKGTNGDEVTFLENVEFLIGRGNGYLRFDNESVIEATTDGIDALAYNVTTVERVEDATRFKTKETGKIILKNLEIYESVDANTQTPINYEYTIYEINNANPAYSLHIISSAKWIDRNGESKDLDVANIELTLTGNDTVEIENLFQLGNVIIEKTGEDNEKLENVEFVLKRGNSYIRIFGMNIAPISNTGIDFSRYIILTVDNIEQATRFRTNAAGKIILRNLEIYESVDPATQIPTKYEYTLCEIRNGNYGYKGITATADGINFTVSENEVITVENKSELGSLQLYKHLDGNLDYKLENIEFAVELTTNERGKYLYLALHDNNDEIVKEVKGTVKINAKNQATADGSEYKLKYISSEKAISELTDAEKEELLDKITLFKTDENGKIAIENLEVYYAKNNEKFTYKIIEINNPFYGFEVESIQLGDIQLETGEVTNVVLGNKQIYTKISGYVWLEKTGGKDNSYDKVYSLESEENNDILLKNLYTTTAEGVTKNENATIPVEIKLRNKETGAIIKSQPDKFDTETGEYTFSEVEIENIANYEVVFEYDGFYYTTLVSNLEADNGSKAEEDKNDRKDLNSLFRQVEEDGKIVAIDGSTTNTAEYNKDGHTSTLSKLNFDTNVSATTSEAGLDFGTLVNQEIPTIVEEIKNVNMGIVSREQPKTKLDSDIYHVYIEVNGRTFTYEYNERTKHYENVNNDEVGVEFEQQNNPYDRYEQLVYSSDVTDFKAGNTTMKVSIVYKVNISNESNTLTTVVKEIANYYDKEYTLEAVGATIEEINQEPGAQNSNYTVVETTNVAGADEVYNCAIINFETSANEEGIKLEKNENKDVYIKFSVSEEAIKGLLEENSTYHNASEIMSYSTLYGERTGKVFNESTQQYEYLVSDNTEVGKVYAGIDKESQPGNIELVLVDHPLGGTQILDTSNFEPDTTSSPSLILKASDARIISGTVFEDSVSNTADNQKLGNGIFETNEKKIQNVTVELWTVNDDGSIGEIAKYSNGEEARVITGTDGKYSFGKYELNADGTIKECYGIRPERYVIKYTYNNQSYIVGKTNVNVKDYKSTIITSPIVKEAFETQNEKWYLVEEKDGNGNIINYSDARDDISLRPEYNLGSDITITNLTYNNLLAIDSMEAYTPIIDVGVEFTQEDIAQALTFTRVEKFENIDFGIIERPDIDITLEKEITDLKITTSTGMNILSANLNNAMQGVKKLDGLVSAEIEGNLLQGAKLSVEYTITVTNNSDKDYLEESYYYYGTGGITDITSRAKKVIDYTDATMELEMEKNQGDWTQVTNLQELYSESNGIGLISRDVYNALGTKEYHVLITEAFEDVSAGESKEAKVYATKSLSSAADITEANRAEIVELFGIRTIKGAVPGNYIPRKVELPGYVRELDQDRVDLIVTTPTGTSVNYTLYIIAAIATFVILVTGIVIIKKKIVK